MSKPILLLLLILASMVTCQPKKKELPENTIPDLTSLQKEVYLDNWQLLGPFYADYATMNPIVDYDHLAQLHFPEKEMKAEDFLSLGQSDTTQAGKDSTFLRNIRYEASHAPIVSHQAFNTTSIANGYAACTLNSAVEQDVAFLLGSMDGVKVWVNQQLCFRLPSGGRALKRSDQVFKVHLKKGANFVLLKMNNSWYKKWWSSFLTVSSVSYARHAIYRPKIQANFLTQSLIKKGDSLSIQMDANFLEAKNAAVLRLFDGAHRQVSSVKLGVGSHWSIPLADLQEGVYRCQLQVDQDTLQQPFLLGNHQEVFKQLETKATSYTSAGKHTIALQTLVNRFHHVDSFGIKHHYDQLLYRKMATIAYELASILSRLQSHQEAFAHLPGLHLRGFPSAIDQHTEHYLVYMPPQYRKNKPIPLVVVFPWVAYKHLPFVESSHVAQIDHIEMMSYLAKQYGFGIVWASSRIYTNYNLNPITMAATLETIAQVKKDYTIDTTRLYAYGNCSGGMLALLAANRFPSLFAAIGVEGPELSYTTYENVIDPEKYPSAWVKENNIFNFASNFTHTPIYLAHSRKDQKADLTLTQALAATVKKTGGTVVLDSLDNVLKTNVFDLYPAETSMQNLFAFFKDKQRQWPKEFSFSTAQLKYNQSYWITLNQLTSGKAKITAKFSEPNTITLTAEHIKEVTIDLGQMPWIAKGKAVRVLVNGNPVYDQVPNSGSITLRVDKEPLMKGLIKNHQIEGPVHDIFKAGFLVVEGTANLGIKQVGSPSPAENFVANWKSHYFGTLPIKKDVELTKADINNYHLVLIGMPNANSLMQQIISKVPLTFDAQSLTIRGKQIQGQNLGYTLIYPNPFNSAKYVLLMGSNNPGILYTENNLSYTGWYDYQIKNLLTNSIIEVGNFTRNWE